MLKENEEQENLNEVKKKKGRRSKNYFAETEEKAVVDYLGATTFDEKNKIYNNHLRDPLDKMISSIIRRYKLYRKDMNFDEIHVDTHSFLMTKIDKFRPSKGKKAYSYFGTICKNYLMGQIMKDQKETNRKIPYEDISSNLEHTPDMIYYIDHEEVTTEEIIEKFLVKLKVLIDNEKITVEENRLGQAIQDLLETYSTRFPDSTNNKFNKNVILFELREMTNLSTKEIRNSMKKFKKIYTEIIQDILNE